MTTDIARRILETFRADIDSEPFKHEQFWAAGTGYKLQCLIHGLPEPCRKCNIPYAREEVASGV